MRANFGEFGGYLFSHEKCYNIGDFILGELYT